MQGIAGFGARVHRRDWGLAQRLGFLDGYEVCARVALLVLSFALFAAAECGNPG